MRIFCNMEQIVIVIIISADRHPVLDIGLFQRLPNRVVLRHSCLSHSRDLKQVVTASYIASVT